MDTSIILFIVLGVVSVSGCLLCLMDCEWCDDDDDEDVFNKNVITSPMVS